ncbi:indole-3-glycerol phosphate synthase TrpC [Reichenbachiella sp. MALMAid0571]|uniref:indole-3-glycerol phosphate synthase TrpC n=1 Tax=Reichenbachiella sp. MALMAid0571 TaxID=3143939 RepID=UPI0032DF094E
MDILEKIVLEKKKEVAAHKENMKVSELEKGESFQRKGISLKRRLIDAEPFGIISEFKRKSPSKGIINDKLDVVETTKGYQHAGASGISILTDTPFFGGTYEDLIRARKELTCPVLRKDFIVDEYQVIETKAMGADVMLLIAACLSKTEITNLAKLARQVGLEILLEIHSEEEYQEDLMEYIDILGVNNRNLKTFETSIYTSINLAEKLSKDVVKISESGLRSIDDLNLINQAGYKGFLIGEQFMRHADPARELKSFLAV